MYNLALPAYHRYFFLSFKLILGLLGWVNVDMLTEGGGDMETPDIIVYGERQIGSEKQKQN